MFPQILLEKRGIARLAVNQRLKPRIPYQPGIQLDTVGLKATLRRRENLFINYLISRKSGKIYPTRLFCKFCGVFPSRDSSPRDYHTYNTSIAAAEIDQGAGATVQRSNNIFYLLTCGRHVRQTYLAKRRTHKRKTHDADRCRNPACGTRKSIYYNWQKSAEPLILKFITKYNINVQRTCSCNKK